MEKTTRTKVVESKSREVYDQPVLIRHGSLRDVTGNSKLYDKVTIDVSN
jgi:hypothetical protein